MKNLCYLLIIVALCTPCFAEKNAKKNDHSSWLTDLDKAQQQAKKENKLILVDFTGSDWCYWCIKLDKEVFAHKEFKEYAKKNLILVMLDFPAKKKLPAQVKEKNDAARKKYGIRGYPTILLLNHKGKEVARTGYKKGGPTNYVKHLSSLVAEYKKNKK